MTTQGNLDPLIALAKRVSENAYCPYSRFRVGAVVMTESGAHFTGCNVENASYGLTICAERNAIFQMIAQSHRHIHLVVIYTPTPTPTAPCGSCRQVIHEFGPEATIISVCDGPDRIEMSANELLPAAFVPAKLDRNP